MIKLSTLTKDLYKPKEVEKMLGIACKTVYQWGSAGRLEFSVTPTGKRMYHRESLIAQLEQLGLLFDDTGESRRDVVYSRVSSNEQKQKGDLDRQALKIIEAVEDLKNPLVLKEVGSGLNDRRPKLKKLIEMIENDQVRNVYVSYKDRLTRFGFEYLKTIAELHETEIIVLNKEDNRTSQSIEDELVEDMMALIASFSGKFYKLRSRREKKDGGNSDSHDRRQDRSDG